MPDRMPNRMSEDMSDRMPEDVPVRTCINVMVGITRSKVIFFGSCRMGPPVDSVQLVFKECLSMVYGRYNKLNNYR